MAKAKAKAKPKPAKHPPKGRRLTGERLLANRPVDPEPPEVSPDKQEQAEAGDEEQLSEVTKKRTPRQKRLPEMEDPEIEELESAAEDYASIRDKRQKLTTEEVRLKTDLLSLMHRENKTEYNHGGVSIKVLVEKEKVRVRIKKDKDDDE